MMDEPTDADLDALAAEMDALPAPERHPRPLGTAQPERTRLAALGPGGYDGGVRMGAWPFHLGITPQHPDPGGYVVIGQWDHTGGAAVPSHGQVASDPTVLARFKTEQE